MPSPIMQAIERKIALAGGAPERTILPLRESPPHVREQRAYTGRRVREIFNWSVGPHPALNDWERRFLVHMGELLARYHGYLEISEKQAEVLLRIEDKVRPPVA